MIAVIGTGRMASEYIKALAALGVPAQDILIVGRRQEVLTEFEATHGIRSLRTDDARSASYLNLERAIVATTPEALSETCRRLMGAACFNILVEKPGALSSIELASLANAAQTANARIHIALNRRFYPSVNKARQLIEADGGVLNCCFDFTDLEDHVLHLRRAGGWAEENFRRWGLVNSSHVIDLAFHLAGMPKILDTRRAGALPWHPTGAEFSGSGQTDRGALFSYLASWGGSGRWRIDVTTRRRRIILCPFEKLQVQSKTSFLSEEIAVDAEPDGLKPGLYNMLMAWLCHDTQKIAHLPDLAEGVQTLSVIESICGYDLRETAN